MDRLTKFGTKAITYNANGEMTSFDGWDYSWSKGKLSRMEKTIGGSSTWAVKPNLPSNPSIPSSKTYSFVYNAFGQRTGVEYSYFISPSSLSPVDDSTTTQQSKKFYYDSAGRLVIETCTRTLYDGGSEHYSIAYLYDGNTMIGMQYTANGTDSLYYFHRNLQGDVVALYDTNGVLKVKYNYDAWGNCTIDNTQTTDIALAKANPIRYRGYYFDVDTGLYYLNARYYSPELRRFISLDDTAYLDPETVDGLNLYAYCCNDPVNYADPSGNGPITAILIGLGIGAIIGGIYGGVSAAILGQNILKGIAIGALVGGLTGAIVEIEALSFMATFLLTFAVGAAGDVASQIYLDNKSYKEINLNTAFWAGVTNASLASVGKRLSNVSRGNITNSDSIIFGTMTNSAFLGLGTAINMSVSVNASTYTINDFEEDIYQKYKSLMWRKRWKKVFSNR